MDFIITKTMVLSNDKDHALNSQNIYIMDGVIADIFEGDIPDSLDAMRIDGSNHITMPTFANAHIHLGETIFRGQSDGMNLEEYLDLSHSLYENDQVMAFENQIHSASARVTLAESAYSGVGCVACSRGHQDVRAIGLKSVCGIPFIRIHKLKKYMENFHQHFLLYQANDDDFVHTGIFIQGLKTVSFQDLKMISEFCSNHRDTCIMIHLSETQQEVAWCLDTYGKTPVELIDSIGLLTTNTLCVHLVHVTENDMDLIRKRGSKPVFCPSANLKLSSGIPPIEQFYKKGIPFSIATDGLAVVGSASLLEQAKMASLLSGGRIPSRELFRAITIHPYQALGFQEFGQIVIGTKADLAMHKAFSSALFPNVDIYSDLIHNSSMFQCDYMWCNGSLVLKNSQLANLNDEDEVFRRHEVINKLKTIDGTPFRTMTQPSP